MSLSNDGNILAIGAYEKNSHDTGQKLGMAHVHVYENENKSGEWTRTSADMYTGRSSGLEFLICFSKPKTIKQTK